MSTAMSGRTRQRGPVGQEGEVGILRDHPLQPRLVAWYGEPQAVYAYSGLTLRPLPWHPVLLELKERLEALIEQLQAA